jgi:hypothetical protein
MPAQRSKGPKRPVGLPEIPPSRLLSSECAGYRLDVADVVTHGTEPPPSLAQLTADIILAYVSNRFTQPGM